MGEGGLVPAPAALVTRQQAQVLRLLLVCAAWAFGQTLLIGLSMDSGLGFVVPAALALGVYAITEDLGRPRFDDGNVKYWRGRRLDDDDKRGGRWN